MRASYYHGNRTFRTGPAPMPTPKAGEALLRVRRVGICGTDLHIYQGHLDHRVPKGGIIGHETFAEVVEAPPGSGFTKADRVVVEPVLSCGACRACRMGAGYLCYQLKVLGVDVPGGMQDYWAVPTARLLKVPDSLSDDHAALVEPLAVATHDVSRARVKAGDAADVAFEVTGNSAAVRVMTDVVRVWGTVSVVAIHAEPMPVHLYPMFARELTMHGSRLYTRAAWEEAIRLASTGAVPVGPLVSRRIPLEDLQKGMEEALAGGPVMKVLVDLAG